MPIANPKTQRRRRSIFSTSNEIPCSVGKILVVRFGDFNGRVLVRDKLEIVREGSAGLIFKFKSGDEEATWWKSRIRLLASIRAYGCRMSSEATGHVETLLGDAERSSSSMQWLASMSNIECERQLLFCQSAGPGHVYRCVPVIRQTRCQKMRSQLSSLVCSRNSKILFNGIPTAENQIPVPVRARHVRKSGYLSLTGSPKMVSSPS